MKSSETSFIDEAAQSFVVRLWQEGPGRWRGTVRHVQSQAQRGITDVRQASDFMAAQCRTAQSRAIPPRTTEPAPRLPVSLSGWGGRRLQLGGLLAGLLLVSLAALLAGRTPADGATLAGAAVGSAPLPLLLTFAAGALAGGVLVAWWGSRSRRRG